MNFHTVLDCDRCNHFYEGECPSHAIIRPISDSIVDPSCSNRAMASLPKGMEIRPSHINNAGLGVFATKSFSNGATFGPYHGQKFKSNMPKVGWDTSYIWEVSV